MYDERGIRIRTKYTELGQAVFGDRGEGFVLLVQMSNLCAVGVVYLVLIGSTMHSVQPLISDSSISWLSHPDQRLWTMVAVVFVMPTVHIGGYRKLAALSALGILCLLAIMVVGTGCALQTIADNEATAAVPEMEWKHLPAVFSMFVFAFSAHGIFPDLKASMQSPRDFPTVIGVVFSLNIVLKTGFTLSCFFAYGVGTMPVVSANFSHVAKIAVSVLIALNTWLSFPLPLLPVFRTIKSRIEATGTEGLSSAGEAVMRSGVVLLCGTLAVLLPNFAVAMGFMGSITLSFLTFIFPATFYLQLKRDRIGPVTTVWAWLVIMVGVLGGIAGVASTIALATHPPK